MTPEVGNNAAVNISNGDATSTDEGSTLTGPARDVSSSSSGTSASTGPTAGSTGTGIAAGETGFGESGSLPDTAAPPVAR